MHIKVKATQELTIVEGKAKESETSGCETNMCGNKEEVSENAGVEKVDNAEDEIRDEFILFNGEWYCDDSTEEDEQKEDRTQSPHEENQREKIAVSHHAVADEEEKRKGTPNNQDGEEKERVTENQVQQANSNKDQKKIERDLGYFLEVDRRHDIWSQIKATKAEIKELERLMQGMKRKPPFMTNCWRITRLHHITSKGRCGTSSNTDFIIRWICRTLYKPGEMYRLSCNHSK